ncbi:hypothetical protein KC717_05885 [Candidatus Dojkabacteria bacterium]|uniref:Uncharacterized protein n=1 Tax=Candidatus Dojkabacteria bacterium TaxID=2099670 RepID=A0A955L8S6_9BACT|nr:hypothetical protein [Candidatus Dojkabacteria bacterium]
MEVLQTPETCMYGAFAVKTKDGYVYDFEHPGIDGKFRSVMVSPPGLMGSFASLERPMTGQEVENFFTEKELV